MDLPLLSASQQLNYSSTTTVQLCVCDWVFPFYALQFCGGVSSPPGLVGQVTFPPTCRPDDCRVHLSVWCHDLSVGIYIQEALCIGVWSSPCYSSFCRCFLNGGVCAYRCLLCLGSILLFMLADLVSCRFILLGFNTVSSHPPRRSDSLELLRWTLLNPGWRNRLLTYASLKECCMWRTVHCQQWNKWCSYLMLTYIFTYIDMAFGCSFVTLKSSE